MKRWLKIVGSVVAIALAGYAVFVLLDAETAELPEVELDAQGQPMDERTLAELKRDKLAEYVRQGIRPGALPDEEDEIEEPPASALGPIGPDEAREGFDYIMRRVEKLGRRRRRLNQDEWRDTYRAANDAFAALSMHLDATDREDAQELEEAHRRLKQALKRVRVKGGKFAPG